MHAASHARPARVRLSDPSRGGQLRDYFLRLGVRAVIENDGTLAVHFSEPPPTGAAGERAELETYLRSWTTVNAVPAELLS